MNYKEAFDFIEELTVEVINNLPKIDSMLDINTKVGIIAKINENTDRILKSLKPKEEYDFDLFNDNNVYDINKVIETYRKLNCEIDLNRVVNGKTITYALSKMSSSKYEEKCLLSIKSTIEIKLRNNKFSKI